MVDVDGVADNGRDLLVVLVVFFNIYNRFASCLFTCFGVSDKRSRIAF